MKFDWDWDKHIGEEEIILDINVSSKSRHSEVLQRSIKVMLKMMQTSSPTYYSNSPFEVRRKLNERLMMSVGRLIVFDVTEKDTLTGAQKVIKCNPLYSPEDRAKFSSRIIVVGDIANTSA